MEIKPNNIYLGDAYELIKQLKDKSVDLIITDPPYEFGTGGIKTGLFKDRENSGTYQDIHDNDLFLAYLRRLHREGVCIMAYGCITTDIPGYIQFHLGRTCSKFYINCADSFRGGKPIKH